jgi:small subunit ribosomal protein S18|uniref:Small ribosomal subunit protein bS18c n=2 Tax=Phaeocystis TaxID=33656 RepID=R9ZRX7_9EUKA|nr:ribosomal protein S18 [Phaeocystis antarctica]YP_008145414.1 ribosomal protein S18 [Phaeocystis globosa]AEK26746.1 ribosomal protein S18 [Phaeocystis antarctica]AGO44876.1 ribosomal protein S18 [Phaeocystis globosa]QRN72621.1 ribosomal protein S18 [Phaeocystis globosa]QRN72729.1 ribosomal protein S18 [Phaeocystis globosa]QRN72837.1 ribosomal protein S18 [Phaeocystis globosa]|tara:strand:- start:4057 stop:4284 length:228 start_codon:yes stop_codon:yes gene_type:complete
MYSNSKKVEGLEISDEILETLDYKNTTVLMTFISDQGKILPRRTTNLTSKQQKKVQKLIKRARVASLLPFVMGKR